MPTRPTSTLSAIGIGTLCLAFASGIHAQEAAALEDAEPAKNGFVKTSVGLSSQSGNTESDSYAARLETEKTLGRTIIRFLADGKYAEAEAVNANGSSEKNQTEGNASLNLNIKQRFDGFYLYLDGLAYHDAPAEIKFRGIASAGVGTFLVDTKTFTFSVDGGAAYVDERTRTENDNYWALRLGDRIEYTFSETVRFWQTAQYLAKVDDLDAWLLGAEFGVESKLTRTLSLNVIFKVDHDSEPAEGTEKTDTTLVAQLACSI